MFVGINVIAFDADIADASRGNSMSAAPPNDISSYDDSTWSPFTYYLYSIEIVINYLISLYGVTA